jgi:hypothetical protein
MRGGKMANPYLHYQDSFGRFLEKSVLLSCLKRVPQLPFLFIAAITVALSPSINRAGLEDITTH